MIMRIGIRDAKLNGNDIKEQGFSQVGVGPSQIIAGLEPKFEDANDKRFSSEQWLIHTPIRIGYELPQQCGITTHPPQVDFQANSRTPKRGIEYMRRQSAHLAYTQFP